MRERINTKGLLEPPKKRNNNSYTMSDFEHSIKGISKRKLKKILKDYPILNSDEILKSLSLDIQHCLDCTSDRISREETNKIYMFIHLYERCIDVIGGASSANAWLMQKSYIFGGKRPFELLCTPVGMLIIEATLERIDYGIYQ